MEVLGGGLVPLLALAAVLPLGVRALGALHARPQRGVLLLVALAPFHGLLLLAGLPGIVNGWKEGLILLTVLVSLIPGPERRRVTASSLPTWLWWALVLVLVGTVSGLLVGGASGALGVKISFFYSLLLIPLLRTPLTARDRDRMITILMTTGVVTALVGVWQQVVGHEFLNAIGYEYNDVIRTTQGRLRSFSTFRQPFQFAFFLMVVVCLAWPVAATSWRRPRNLLFFLLLPVVFLGMGSAFVRGALLGTGVGVLVLVWRQRVRLRWLALAAAVPAVLAPWEQLGALLSARSLGQRVMIWTEKFQQLFAEPFGHGVGSSGSAAEAVAGATGTYFQPDNAYFHYGYQLGPLGVWLLVHALVAVVATGLRLSRQLPPETAAWCLGISLATSGAMAASFVANYFEIFPVDLLFWACLGILTALDMEVRQREVASHDGTQSVKCGGQAAALVSVAVPSPALEGTAIPAWPSTR